ncbi:MAG: hypothetical protein KIT26_06575 [Nitrosomonas sp.]|nr:hypothetical protein [Nitrosomonas sp.]
MDVKHQPLKNGNDAAWAVLHTPLSVPELTQFCHDIERLFRINPMLNVRNWQNLGNNRYFFSGQNISQQTPFDFDLVLTVRQLSNGLQIEYDQGVKSRTTFIIEPASGLPGCRSRLTITDYYDALPENERLQQLHRVDKSILIWAYDLQRFLIHWHRWSKYRLWRWYMQRVWQPMKPMGRRITVILLWVTAAELALVLLGAAIYFLDYAA